MKEIKVKKENMLTGNTVYYNFVLTSRLEENLLNILEHMLKEDSIFNSLSAQDFPEISYSLLSSLPFEIENKFNNLTLYTEDEQCVLLIKMVQSIDKSLIEYSN